MKRNYLSDSITKASVLAIAASVLPSYNSKTKKPKETKAKLHSELTHGVEKVVFWIRRMSSERPIVIFSMDYDHLPQQCIMLQSMGALGCAVVRQGACS